MQEKTYHKRWRDIVRTSILLRDSFTCRVCASVSISNHVHHIDNNPAHNHPDNLITLCLECHNLATYRKLHFTTTPHESGFIVNFDLRDVLNLVNSCLEAERKKSI
jgi:5-methylcytosine-specific restriction endonuclease McrA